MGGLNKVRLEVGAEMFNCKGGLRCLIGTFPGDPSIALERRTVLKTNINLRARVNK